MKKTAFILFLLAISQVSFFSQASDIPASELFDSQQLLRDVEILAADDMEGRGFGAPGGLKARDYVVKRFKEAGIEDINGKNLQPFSITGRDKVERQGANVYGVIRGSKNPDKYIVISAHYDHVGTLNGEVYNGGDDDASGTAGLFAIASYFHKNRPQTSLLFVAFDAEESGLVGSRKFVAEPPVPFASIVLNINMDMVGHSDKNELYASGMYHNPFLKPFVEPLAKDAKVKLLFGHDRPEQKNDDWTNQSDHGSFHRQKIPFIYFGVEDHKDYHKPTDDYSTLTKGFYVYAVETVLAAVKALDPNTVAIAKQSPERPDPRAEQDIRALNEEYDRAIVTRDAAIFERILTDDFIFTSFDGSVSNKRGEIEKLKTRKIAFESGKSDDIRVKIYGNTAIVTGRFAARGISDGKPFEFAERYTAVFVKLTDRWQIAAEQSTEISNKGK